MTGKFNTVKFLLITMTIIATVFVHDVKSDKEDDGSLFEIAQSLLQESVRNQNSGSGINVLGSVVQGLMQSEGGKQLGDILTKGGGNAAFDLISGLASAWQTSKYNYGADVDGGKQDGTIDPSILGSMVDLFSTINKVSNDADNNNVDENNNDKQDFKRRKNKQNEEQAVNWDAVLSFAGSMISSMSNTNQKNDYNESPTGALDSFLSFLPVLMNSLTGNHNHHSSHSIPHHTHPQFLPPFLENIHEYWDYFLTTDFGKTLWKNSGLSDLVKMFSDSEGQIQTKKIFQSLENNTLRRQWIKSIANFVAQWMKHFTNPEIQKSYLETGQIICNSFLQSQGYPKETYLNFKKPGKSISALVNTVFKKQFNLKVNSENYVVPAVEYIQELFKLKQKSGMFKISSEDIETKLSKTLDRDVIEPVLRVNRAYEFALKRPECAKYVVCRVNESDKGKSGMKPGITKLLSLGASWFLSTTQNTLFLDFYNAAIEDESCQKFNKNCGDFDVENTKATTEYYHHSEL